MTEPQSNSTSKNDEPRTDLEIASQGVGKDVAVKVADSRGDRPVVQTGLPGSRAVTVAAGAVIVVAGLRAASAIMLPVLIALFVSILSYPLLARLRKSKVPLALAVAITLLADFALLVGAAALVSGSVSELVRERNTYEQRIREYGEQIEKQRASAASWFEGRNLEPPSWLQRPVTEDPVDASGVATPGTASWWIDIVDLDAIFGAANLAVRGAANVVTSVLIITLITAFILLEAATFPRKLAKALQNRRAADRYRNVTRELQHYLLIKTAIGLATGLMVGLWVAACGLNSPALWGFVAFALNYVPNLGSIIAAVPAILFAVLQLGLGSALLVAIGYLVINIVVGNFLEPQILGAQLGLSPLAVFLSLVFWGWVWGPAGMILSVPITMVVKLGLENTQDLRWLAVLLDRGPSRAASKKPASL